MTHEKDDMDHRRLVAIGYLSSGNSLWDLIKMFRDDDQLSELYDDIVVDFNNEDEIDTKEQLDYLEKVGHQVEERQMLILEG